MSLELNSFLEISIVKACLQQYIECCQNSTRELEEDEKEFFRTAKKIYLDILNVYDDYKEED